MKWFVIENDSKMEKNQISELPYKYLNYTIKIDKYQKLLKKVDRCLDSDIKKWSFLSEVNSPKGKKKGSSPKKGGSPVNVKGQQGLEIQKDIK